MLKNRMAIKALIRCTIFLLIATIPTTNFGKLVDLIVSYSAEELKRFLERAGTNACNLHIQNSCC